MDDPPHLRRQTDDDRLRRVEHLLFGNGTPGLAERTRRIERFMFEDPATGEKGLVNDVKTLTSTVRSFQTTLPTLNWILGLGGATGLLAFLRSVFGT